MVVAARLLPLLIAGWVGGAARVAGHEPRADAGRRPDAADPEHGAAEVDRQG